MKVAVASLGTVPEALVGIRFGACSQFLVFDLDTMHFAVVSVPPHLQPEEHVSLEAIRAVARQDVSAVITGAIKDTCRRTLEELGIDVISGVQGMTVIEAIERYKATRLAAPESRQGPVVRIAVASHGEGMDARLETGFGDCVSFTIVNPQTKEWDVVRVEQGAAAHAVNLDGVRTVVRNGAGVVITPQLSPGCRMALQALAVVVYIAPAGITVREAIELYEQGRLEETGSAY
jgi:predicted Fe-Mo cluster-binding NifX family protein